MDSLFFNGQFFGKCCFSVSYSVFHILAYFQFLKHGLFNIPGSNTLPVCFDLVGFLVELDFQGFGFKVFAVDLA